MIHTVDCEYRILNFGTNKVSEYKMAEVYKDTKGGYIGYTLAPDFDYRSLTEMNTEYDKMLGAFDKAALKVHNCKIVCEE